MEHKKLENPFPFRDPNGKEITEPALDNKKCCYWIWGDASYGKNKWLNE